METLEEAAARIKALKEGANEEAKVEELEETAKLEQVEEVKE